MKNAARSKIDLALDAQMKELECFFLRPRPAPELSVNETQELQLPFDIDASIPRRRGRPFSWRSRNERTFQSCEAFVFVAGEMRIFKQRNGLKQVPKKVREKFIEFAKRKEMFPKADVQLIEDHLKKDQRIFATYFAAYKEPTFFQLVRHEYDDGSVANIIVGTPAIERLRLCT